MKKEKITAIKVCPLKHPEVVCIENSLESLQHEVNGFIEGIYPYDDPVCLVVNEEGKINGMEFNRALRDEDGEIYDIIAGDFLIVGLSDEDDFDDMPKNLIDKYTSLFAKGERFVRINGKIVVVYCDN